MARITAIFLSCVLLTASSLLASNVEETYQAALMQEKGEGNLEEAIRLYQQVIEAHEKGKGDEKMAARAQLRIGVCQEKLGSGTGAPDLRGCNRRASQATAGAGGSGTTPRIDSAARGNNRRQAVLPHRR